MSAAIDLSYASYIRLLGAVPSGDGALSSRSQAAYSLLKNAKETGNVTVEGESLRFDEALGLYNQSKKSDGQSSTKLSKDNVLLAQEYGNAKQSTESFIPDFLPPLGPQLPPLGEGKKNTDQSSIANDNRGIPPSSSDEKILKELGVLDLTPSSSTLVDPGTYDWGSLSTPAITSSPTLLNTQSMITMSKIAAKQSLLAAQSYATALAGGASVRSLAEYVLTA